MVQKMVAQVRREEQAERWECFAGFRVYCFLFNKEKEMIPEKLLHQQKAIVLDGAPAIETRVHFHYDDGPAIRRAICRARRYSQRKNTA